MAKKSERYQNEKVTFSNPFAALVGAGASASEASVPCELPEKTAPAPDVRLPKVRSARIERAHRGGKTVTVVTFHGTPSDDEKNAWLKAFKKELGVGGSIEDGVVCLQGDQRERLKN
ncbi:MAG: translation initiation factor [Proteobacteria bacterium]|nr:translation initiation factor [Pseudomonadota bacterium]